MAVTVNGFLAKNTIFNGRLPASIQGALDEAAKHFAAAACGDLHEPLIEAQARVILLEDPNGLPTSTTGQDKLKEDALDRLQRLKRLVPLRGLGTVGDPTGFGPGWIP